jgi:hypothetical protein
MLGVSPAGNRLGDGVAESRFQYTHAGASEEARFQVIENAAVQEKALSEWIQSLNSGPIALCGGGVPRFPLLPLRLCRYGGFDGGSKSCGA